MRLKTLTTPLPPRANAIVTIAFMLGVALLLGSLFIMGGPPGSFWIWVANLVWFGIMVGVVIWKQIKVLVQTDLRMPPDGGQET